MGTRFGWESRRAGAIFWKNTRRSKEKTSREYDKENASPPRWKNGKVIVDPDEPEQNRVVFAGHRVKVDVVEDSFVPGVKTPEDLRRLNAGLGTGLVNDLALTFLVA